MNLIVTWMRILARLFRAGNAAPSVPSILIVTPSKSTTGSPPMLDLVNKRISLLRPFPKEIPISSPMGEREINGKKEIHQGYDFKTYVGTPVLACHDGAVFRAGWQDEFDHSSGFGLRVWEEIEIEGQRLYLYYAHLSKILVKEGDRIHRGQEIALTGNTGRSTGPHMHFEVRLKDTKVRFQVEWELS